jgi:hypothetical protein
VTANSLRSGELARLTGVSADTLRHYERLGHFRTDKCRDIGCFLYPVVRRNSIWVVETAEKRGFPIDSILYLLGMFDGPISGSSTIALPAEFMPVCFDFELLFSRDSPSFPNCSATCSNS